MASDNSVFQPLVVLFIVLFIVAAIVSLFFNTGSNYYSNEFLVSLNNTKLKYIYREKYNNKITKENYDIGENFQDILITKNDIYLLDFNEYEVYDFNNLRVNGKFYNKLIDDQYTYKIVKNEVKIKIKKNGKVLYNGEFVKDLTNYLKETGRYYVHIYNTRKEHGNKVFTDLSMTFLLVDSGVNND